MDPVNVWGCLCHSSDGEGVLNLRLQIPEVFVFKGSSLVGWYGTNKHGVVVKRKSPPTLEEVCACAEEALLGGVAPGGVRPGLPEPPAAILRKGVTLLAEGESAAVDIPGVTVLDVGGLRSLMQQVREGRCEQAEVWSVQPYFKPQNGVRILSVYTCDLEGQERSDVFGRRFGKVYTTSEATQVPDPEDVAADGGFLNIHDARRAQVEAKTLGAVRFASRFHSLDFEGLVLEFVVDPQDRAVLHGCWSSSLFGPDAKRVRPSSVADIDERAYSPSKYSIPQRIFPVPCVREGLAADTLEFDRTVPQADETTSPKLRSKPRRPASASAFAAAEDTDAVVSPAQEPSEGPIDSIYPWHTSTEDNYISQECSVLLEVWRGEAFLGETLLPHHPPGSPPKEFNLPLNQPSGGSQSSRADPRKSRDNGRDSGGRPLPDRASIARVSTSISWKGKAQGRKSLAVKIGEANSLQVSPADGEQGVRAMLWLRRRGRSDWEPLWGSANASHNGQAAQPWVWDEEADLGLHPLPASASPAAGVDRCSSAHKIKTTVCKNNQVVLGARVNDHWGFGEDGCMRTSTLASQVVQRNTGKKARSSMHVHIASQLDRCHKAKLALDEYLEEAQAFTAKVDSEAPDREAEVRGLEQAIASMEAAHKAKLAQACRDMQAKLDDNNADLHVETFKYDQACHRCNEKRELIKAEENKRKNLQDTLNKTVSKFDEVSSSYAVIQIELAKTHKARTKDIDEPSASAKAMQELDDTAAQEELHLARRELQMAHSASARAHRDLQHEKEWAMKLEDFIARITSSPCTARCGGGFEMDNTAMKEAAWLLQELQRDRTAAEYAAQVEASGSCAERERMGATL